MTELILQGYKMATQKILKLVSIIIISAAIATNTQAAVIERTITPTMVSQAPRQIPPTPALFPTFGKDFALSSDSIQYSAISKQQDEQYDVIPPDLSVFAYERNRNWNLLELCLYGQTMPVSWPIQAEITANEVISYIPSTEGPLWENRLEFAQIDTDGRWPFGRDIFYDREAFCSVGITPLSIQSSLDNTVFTVGELDELYEWEFVLWGLCYMNDFYYNLSTFFEDSNRFFVTYRPDGNISPAAIPEPATLVLLSFGTLVLVGKRR
jgi:hypothetical protein